MLTVQSAAAELICENEDYWKIVSCDLLKKHLPPKGQTILDYGCGRGESVKIFGEAGYQVTGTDVDPECVKLASRFGTACELQPETPLEQFGAKTFDAVICFHVLEHVDNPRKTLTALAQIARQYVVIAVPNLRFLHRLTTRKINLGVVNDGHLQGWDHWHFRNLAERFCGLELVEWGFDATELPVLTYASQKLLGMRATIALETQVFRRIFPFHGISIIGLFRVKG